MSFIRRDCVKILIVVYILLPVLLDVVRGTWLFRACIFCVGLNPCRARERVDVVLVFVLEESTELFALFVRDNGCFCCFLFG